MNNLHKITYLISILLCFNFGQLLTQNTKNLNNQEKLIKGIVLDTLSKDSTAIDSLILIPIKIVLAKTQIGFGIDSLDNWKVHAALTLATKLTNKYNLISFEEIDSLKNILGRIPSISEVHDSLNADYLAMVNINQFENMLGVDLKLVEGTNAKSVKMGRGYSKLNFQLENSKLKIYDPPLLKAIQRAFAGAIKDTMLYDTLNGGLNVYPAAATVIGGINYINNDKLRKWDLFETRVVSSYYACETIFEFGKDNKFYEIYDMDSRDSIYSMYRLYGVENYDLPSKHELKALKEMEIECYITGQFIRIEDGALLKLYLSKLEDEKLIITKKTEAILEEDNLEKYGLLLKKLTKELLNITE